MLGIEPGPPKWFAKALTARLWIRFMSAPLILSVFKDLLSRYLTPKASRSELCFYLILILSRPGMQYRVIKKIIIMIIITITTTSTSATTTIIIIMQIYSRYKEIHHLKRRWEKGHHVGASGKAAQNSSFFSNRLKISSDGARRVSVDKLFHRVGAAKLNCSINNGQFVCSINNGQ